MGNLVERVKTKWKEWIILTLMLILTANITGIFSPPSLYDWYQDHTKQEETNSQIDSLLRNADSLVVASDYENAIGEYKNVLKLISPLKNPAEYGRTQESLGTAYNDLSVVRDEEENLNKAIQAYEEALKIGTIQKYPIDYAKTQTNLRTSLRAANRTA